jgi:hypothetical protein
MASNTISMCVDANKQIAAGKKVLLVFRSKSQMYEVLKAINGNHLAIHGATMMSINHLLDDINVLAYTTKVTVGADIQVLFGSVYLFADSRKGCSARDMIQQMGRARNIEQEVGQIAFPVIDQ